MHPVIFVWDGINQAGLKIKRPQGVRPAVLKGKEVPTKAEQAKIDAFNELVAANRGHEVIRFQARGIAAKPWSTFTTSNPKLVDYVRQHKAGRPIREDLSLMPVRCPYCDYTTASNTPHEQELLAAHIAASHQDVLDVDHTG